VSKWKRVGNIINDEDGRLVASLHGWPAAQAVKDGDLIAAAPDLAALLLEWSESSFTSERDENLWQADFAFRVGQVLERAGIR
jgi:hypothetical protein